jgi:hypothetical protein
MSFILSLRNILADNEVSVMVETIAHSVAANSALMFYYSTPAFAVAILAWKGIPSFAATVLNNKIDGLVPFF